MTSFSHVVAAAFVLPILAAGGSPTTVTVVLSFEREGYSPGALNAMRDEAQSILKPSNLHLEWQLLEKLQGHPEFGEMVVLKMSGKCAMDAVPVIPDELGLPLGMTYASDGEILSFGQIDCDRVRQSVGRVVTGGRRDDGVLGRALGRVVAHEMYHMLSHSKTHTQSGATSKSLSSADLTGRTLAIPKPASDALKTRVKSLIGPAQE